VLRNKTQDFVWKYKVKFVELESKRVINPDKTSYSVTKIVIFGFKPIYEFKTKSKTSKSCRINTDVARTDIDNFFKHVQTADTLYQNN
jgi:hypothetical protein